MLGALRKIVLKKNPNAKIDPIGPEKIPRDLKKHPIKTAKKRKPITTESVIADAKRKPTDEEVEESLRSKRPFDEWREMNDFERREYNEYLIRREIRGNKRDPYHEIENLDPQTPKQKELAREAQEIIEEIDKLIPEKPKITQEELVKLYHIKQGEKVPSKYDPVAGYKRLADMSYQEALYSRSSPFYIFGGILDFLSRAYRDVIFKTYKKRGDFNLLNLEKDWETRRRWDLTDEEFDYKKYLIQTQEEEAFLKNLKRPVPPNLIKQKSVSVKESTSAVRTKSDQEIKAAGLIFNFWKTKRRMRKSWHRFRDFAKRFMTDPEYRSFPAPITSQKDIIEEAERERRKQKEEEEKLQREQLFGVQIDTGNRFGFDERWIQSALRPSTLIISPPYDPAVLPTEVLTIGEAVEMTIPKKESGEPDLLDIYNSVSTASMNNDPARGGSDLLQNKLFGAGDATAEVYNYFGTTSPSKLFDEKNIEDIIRELEEKAEKVDSMTDQEIELDTRSDPGYHYATHFNNTPIEEFISASSLDYLRLNMKMLERQTTDQQEYKSKLYGLVGQVMKKEWEMVNQHRADSKEPRPLSELEWLSRMLRGERMEDKSNAGESIERWIRAQNDFYTANEINLPLPHAYLERVLYDGMEEFRVPAQFDNKVNFILSQERNIVDNYLDAINNEIMEPTDSKDANASVEYLGERGERIVEAVKSYPIEFETDMEDALIRRVGKTWYREGVENWTERWMVLSDLEYRVFKQHNSVPFWMEVEKKLFPKPFLPDNRGEEDRRNMRKSITEKLMAESKINNGAPVDETVLKDLLNGETIESAAATLEPPAFYHNKEDPEWLWRHNWNLSNSPRTPSLRPFNWEMEYGVSDHYFDPIEKFERGYDLTYFDIMIIRRIIGKDQEALDRLQEQIQTGLLKIEIEHRFEKIVESAIREEGLIRDEEERLEEEKQKKEEELTEEEQQDKTYDDRMKPFREEPKIDEWIIEYRAKKIEKQKKQEKMKKREEMIKKAGGPEMIDPSILEESAEQEPENQQEQEKTS